MDFNELLEYLQRGDITSSSFAFTIPNEAGAERWYKKDGQIYRDIYKIDKLFDVSPVFQPAYEATSCSARYSEVKALSDEVDSIMNLYKEEIDNL
jgi:phage head maturation protease